MVEDSLQKVERKLFQSGYKLISDVDTFPVTNREYIINMVNGYFRDTDRVHLYAFINDSDYTRPFIDIYIFDAMLYPDCFKRFIICPGYRLNTKDEELLCAYIKKLDSSEVCVDEKQLINLFKAVNNIFPQLNFGYYPTHRLNEAFDHLYFASFRSGPKEILYKASLNNIAYSLSCIPGYNMIGSTPSEIIVNDKGIGLPLKLLHILNDNGMVDRLFFKDRMNHALLTYNRFSSYIDSRTISGGQFAYLEGLCLENAAVANYGFSRKLFNRLEDRSECVYDEYEVYLTMKSILGDSDIGDLPEVDELCEVNEKLFQTLQYLNDEKLEERIRKRNKSFYYYENSDYIVTMPNGGVLDFYKEAMMQNSCVLSYVEKHADINDPTTILFLRKRDDIDRSYVTIEIKDNIISQAYGRFNELPDISVYRFLEEYSKKMWLVYNPFSLITKDELRKVKDRFKRRRLKNYMREYKLKNQYPCFVNMNTTGIQLTVFDYLDEYVKDTVST